MNGWSAQDYALGSTVVGASASNSPVTKEFPITAGGALNMVIAIDASAVTVGTGITAKLQTAIGSTWQDSKTVAIAANGRVYIKLNIEVAGDQTFLPSLNKGRVVITSGAGDTATVASVNVLQEL